MIWRLVFGVLVLGIVADGQRREWRPWRRPPIRFSIDYQYSREQHQDNPQHHHHDHQDYHHHQDHDQHQDHQSYYGQNNNGHNTGYNNGYNNGHNSGYNNGQSTEFEEMRNTFDIGASCSTHESMPGTCLFVSRCRGATEAIRNGVRPIVCSFEAREPVICCPKLDNGENQPNYGQTTPQPRPMPTPKPKPAKMGISKIKCDEFIESAPEAKFYLTVVGGTPAKAQDFPHMAALGYGPEDNKQWKCGGTLISDRFVLTAAHCLQSQSLGQVEWVRLGDVDLERDDDDAKPQEYRIAERIRHPQFRINSRYNDLALLQLEEKVTFTDYVYPACLPQMGEDTVENAQATGWGRTEFGGEASNQLLKVWLDIFPTEECTQYYGPNTNRLHKGIDGQSQLCAGSKNEEKDTCDGDSGGPLQTSKIGVVSTVIGITSFGKICGQAGLPAVYTKVSNYVPWIETIVWP